MRKIVLFLASTGLTSVLALAGCTPAAAPLSAPPSAPLSAPLSAPPLPESVAPARQASSIGPEHAQILAKLSNQGPAPELTNEIWLNSAPLQLANLRSKVVIVEFWTYG